MSSGGRGRIAGLGRVVLAQPGLNDFHGDEARDERHQERRDNLEEEIRGNCRSAARPASASDSFVISNSMASVGVTIRFAMNTAATPANPQPGRQSGAGPQPRMQPQPTE